jgi:hypothetical protein
MKKKIFIGTLYSGEEEFEECCSIIKKQKDVNIEHFIIKNLKNNGDSVARLVTALYIKPALKRAESTALIPLKIILGFDIDIIIF